MAKLSISNAWTEGARFATREFRLVYPIALLLMALPGLLVGLLTPQANDGSLYDLQSFVRQNGAAPVIILSIVLGLAVFVMQTLGSLAITYLALRPGSSVAESFAAAMRRLPATMGAILLIALCFMVAIFPIFLLLGSAGATPSPGAAAGMLTFMLIIAVLSLALYARLLPLTPVAVSERLGPIGIIKRSWRLTAGHFWLLFGTMLAVGVVYMIVALMFSMMIGLLLLVAIGPPGLDPTATFVLELLTALFTSAVAVFLLSFIARIYAQLAPRAEETGQVFS